MSQPAATKTNQRQFRRVACRITGSLICDTGLKLPCETTDISEGGVLVVVPTGLRGVRGHTIEAVSLRGVPPLAVQMRWARNQQVGLAFTGGKEDRDLVCALLTHLEKARAEALRAKAEAVQAKPS